MRTKRTAPDSGDAAADPWWLYVLLCANGRLYVGIAKDVDARFAVHRAGKGAFFTRLNAPVRVLARQVHPSRSAALRSEYALKQRTRQQKLLWIAAVAGEPAATPGPAPG